MNIDYLCMGCFKEKGNAEICPHCGYKEGTAPSAPYHLPCRTILNGKYLIGKVLGSGGFGVTYLAWDMNLFMKLAIKEYFPTEMASRSLESPAISVYSGSLKDNFNSGLDKFLDEARMLAKFHSHPGIISIRDFFRENGTAYIVMEFVEGITLKQYLEQKGGKLPYIDALNLMMPVITSLKEVHDTGLLHRDISPDNIYISTDGKVKLLDFGAARFALRDYSKSLSVILKPGYAPYEQYSSRGNQGPWTDIYAIAATFYRIITGQLPPDAPDRLAEDTEDSLKAPSSLGVDIPQNAERALLKALSIRAAERFQDIKEFKAALLGEIPVEDSPSKAAGSNFDGNNIDNNVKYQGNTIPLQNTSYVENNGAAQNINQSTIPQKSSLQRMLPLLACAAGLVIVLLIGTIFIITGNKGSDSNDPKVPVLSDTGTNDHNTIKLNTGKNASSAGSSAKEPAKEDNKKPDFSPLENILSSSSNRNYSVYIKDLNSGEIYTHGNASDTFPALGEFFIPLVVTSCANLKPQTTVNFCNADITADAKGNAAYYFDNSFTVESLVETVLSKSDNTAANKLISLLGNGNCSNGLSIINSSMAKIGCSNTSAGRVLLDTEASTDNYTSAKDIGTILEKLMEVPELLDFMAKCTPEKNDAIRNGFSSSSDLKIVSKFGIAPKGYRGNNENIYHCCAGVKSNDSKIKFVICVLSSGSGDNTSAYGTISELASKTYSILNVMN